MVLAVAKKRQAVLHIAGTGKNQTMRYGQKLVTLDQAAM